ncbi:MAG TPA: hotdog fold thioesterase, partial [Myxococcota bacterium]
VYVLMAESAASGAAAFAVDVTQFRIAGQEISASHVRSAVSGRLSAEAHLVHRGKSALVYTVDVMNDDKLVSTCRCTIAVRPL